MADMSTWFYNRRNLGVWIERETGKAFSWSPFYEGQIGGRDVWRIYWHDGTTGLYFIDFVNEKIEPAA